MSGARPVVVVLALVALSVSGCTTRRGASRTEPARGEVTDVEIPLVVPLGKDDARETRLPATLTTPAGSAPFTLVLVVPGGGNVSRRGTRTGDGEVEYAEPVHTSEELASLFAAHGMATLAWDKRTCTPRDDRACEKHPLDDVEREGPRALAADVDAACAFAEALPRTGSIVLWAHGQAAQVALSSTCAERAATIVLVAPPPRRIDRVLVDGLRHRSGELAASAKRAKGDDKRALDARARAMKQRAAELDETFKALVAGKFPNDARLMGFAIPYWRGWLALTDEIPGKDPRPRVPWIVVMGEHDVQFSPADRARIERLGTLPRATGFVAKGVDHHLLARDEALRAGVDEAALMPILEALSALPTDTRDDPGEV